MKRLVFLILLLAVLFLMGCQEATAPVETVTTTASVQETQLTIPTETQPPPLPPAPEYDEAFVRVLDYIPMASQELRYATVNNFTGRQIYDFYEAYLRWGTVKKLIAVSEELARQGLFLKIWDGFRPVSAQFALWEACPDPTYVANPQKGYSSHSRGNTVDLTLVDETGQELEMPTGFDDFSLLANRDYSDCTETAAANAMLLEEIMTKHGFSPYYGEWWHFSDTQSYPVEKEFEPCYG